MARKRTRLAYITGAAARNASLRKRRLCLLKKVSELSILCDVPACAVVYSPNETQPEVWPSAEAARDLLRQFDGAGAVAKGNNMMNQEKFLVKQIVKVRTQLGRVMAENADLYGELLLRRCLAGRHFSCLGWDELVSVDRAICCRAEAVKARILQISLTVDENPLHPTLPLLPPLFSPEVQNQIFLMAPAPPASGLPEIELKQGISVFSEEYSGGGALLPSTPLPFPPSLNILSPVEMGVMESKDLPAGYGGAAPAPAPGFDLPEMGGFGVSSEPEQDTAPENYLPTWEEFESYFLKD